MSKYDERFAQEAQEEEYLKLKHLDDEYWYAVFSQDLRIQAPPFIAVGYNQHAEQVLVRACTMDELMLKCKQHDLTVVAKFQPKQFV